MIVTDIKTVNGIICPLFAIGPFHYKEDLWVGPQDNEAQLNQSL